MWDLPKNFCYYATGYYALQHFLSGQTSRRHKRHERKANVSIEQTTKTQRPQCFPIYLYNKKTFFDRPKLLQFYPKFQLSSSFFQQARLRPNLFQREDPRKLNIGAKYIQVQSSKHTQSEKDTHQYFMMIVQWWGNCHHKMLFPLFLSLFYRYLL